MRFTFETNVLVYAADRGARNRHRITLDLVRRTRGRGKASPARAIEIVQAWRDTAPVFAADETCLVDAVDAVTRHG